MHRQRFWLNAAFFSSMTLYPFVSPVICCILICTFAAQSFAQSNDDSATPVPADTSISAGTSDHSNIRAAWFEPSSLSSWFNIVQKNANQNYLNEFFQAQNYTPPNRTFALIAPIKTDNNKVQMQYFSYGDTAFVYSMTPDGQQRYWPASTVKLTAAVLALLKLREFGLTSQANVQIDDIEGHYDNTVEKLCRDAIIPSSNTAYNRLMEIAGFDDINDRVLPKVFHFPTTVMQRRYARKHPDDNLRYSPQIAYREGDTTGTIPARQSAGTKRPQCPREANCTTLAELAEVMFRVMMHDYLPASYRFDLTKNDISMLQRMLLKAPSCIGRGTASAMGEKTLIYNKGGKVIGDDRLEIAFVSSPDKKERYLIALSVPYHTDVETDTNKLAQMLITAVQKQASPF